MSFWDQVVANPRFWLAAGALLSVTAIECLLALWAATATKDRLVRVAVVWLAIAALVPIRAEIPALFFTLNATLTILLISTVRFLTRERAGRESRWAGWHRFSLGDIFVLTIFIATMLGISLRIRGPIWLPLAMLLWTAPLTAVSSLSYFAVQGRNRWRVLIFLVAALMIFAGFGLVAWRLLHFPASPGGLSPIEMRALSLHGPLLGSLVLLAYFTILLGRSVWQSLRSRENIWRGSGRRVGMVVVITLLALLVWYGESVITWRLADEGWRLLLLILTALPLTLLAMIVASATALARIQTASSVWRRMFQIAGGLAALVVAMPLAWLYWQMAWLPAFPPFASDSPTNYHRLIAIARQLNEMQLRYGAGLPTEARPLLDEATQLLGAPNYIPVAALEEETQRPPPASALKYHDLFAVRGGFEMLASESQGAGSFDRATDHALSVLRFGTMLQRGGTSGHSGMGWHVQGWALGIIRETAQDMSPEKRCEVIRALDDALQKREEPAVQLARDRIYHDWSSGWEGRFRTVITELAPPPPPATKSDYEDNFRSELALRALQLNLAIMQCARDRGRKPTELAELVPEYLDSVPLDPYSGQPFLYRMTEPHAHILYSTGPDGIDDGGRFSQEAMYALEPGFDLELK
jgi:hypothetical protein